MDKKYKVRLVDEIGTDLVANMDWLASELRIPNLRAHIVQIEHNLAVLKMVLKRQIIQFFKEKIVEYIKINRMVKHFRFCDICLGFYGYHNEKTEAMEQLVKEGVIISKSRGWYKAHDNIIEAIEEME